MRPGALVSEAEARARVGDYAGALALREQAYAALRAEGETRAAARLAGYQIAFDHLALFGSTAVAQGWLARAVRLVEECGDCAEAGWVALAQALHTGDAEQRDRWITAAERAAETFQDEDLHFDALAHRGLSTVRAGRVTDGMRQLDEAAAAAYAGEVDDPVVAGEVYCKLMVACETVLDVPRAEEWHQAFGRLDRRPEVAWASAICRMHVGAVWSAAGRWQEADSELNRAIELFDATYVALRPAACARLAELRVRQGRLEEAERLVASARDDAFAIRAGSRLAWHRAATDTERTAAAAALAELLAQHEGDLSFVPDRTALTELQLACGELEAAAATAARLAEMAGGDVGEALTGYARWARGLVAAAKAEPEAGPVLRRAARHFAEARLPLEQAGAQVAHARAVARSDPGTAVAQARQASETFARLDATSELDRTAALLRSLGSRPYRAPRAHAPLTGREHDVLLLVADGLSNPEIAQRLFLSRRTVAHHVSNLLSKLGVRNRGEAAAWLVAHGSAGDPRSNGPER